MSIMASKSEIPSQVLELKNLSLGCTFLFRILRRASTHSFERRRKRALWRLWWRRPRPTRRPTRRPRERGQPPTGREGAPNGRGSGRAQYQSDVLNVPLCQGKPTEANMSDLV